MIHDSPITQSFVVPGLKPDLKIDSSRDSLRPAFGAYTDADENKKTQLLIQIEKEDSISINHTTTVWKDDDAQPDVLQS